MANNPKSITVVDYIKTKANLETLASGGSLTRDSDTLTADENRLYLVDDDSVLYTQQTLSEAQQEQARTNINANIKSLSGTTAPTTSTVGVVGQFYLDTTTTKLYQCKAITEDTSTTPSTFTYTWGEVGGGSGKYLHELSLSGTNIRLNFHYISTKSTATTQISDLIDDIVNYVSVNSQPIQATGYYVVSGQRVPISWVEPRTYPGKALRISYIDTQYSTQQITIDDTSYTFITAVDTNHTGQYDVQSGISTWTDRVTEL